MVSSSEWHRAVPTELHQFAHGMHQQQQRNENQLQERRDRRREAVRNLAAQWAADVPVPDDEDRFLTPPRRPTEPNTTCAICQDETHGEDVVQLTCMHVFHRMCSDEWVAHQLESNQTPRCPTCRRFLVVRAHYRAEIPSYHIGTPTSEMQGSPGTYVTAATSATESEHDDEDHDLLLAAEEDNSSTFAAPWWPVQGAGDPTAASACYHASTQLDNRLSMIVDIGAWTNLMGERLSRALAARAMSQGYTPTQERMTTPLQIQGVGDGTQECRWQISCPIAVPYADGRARLHRVTAPVVTGTGANLPGLLGLKSLEQERSIIDIGNKMLYFPGPGDVRLELPPGTAAVPLVKAPSGHLVVVIDSYEAVDARRGGVPEASLQLHARPVDDSTTATNTTPTTTTKGTTATRGPGGELEGEPAAARLAESPPLWPVGPTESGHQEA